MELYLRDRGYSLNNQIKYNSQQCELITLQWLIEDSMATLLQLSCIDTNLNIVLPEDFVCEVPQKLQVGQKITIKPTFVPNNTTDTTSTCVSDNPQVVSVKTYGDKHELTALAQGTAVIGITSVANPNIVHKYTITVTPAPVVQQDNIYYGIIPQSLGVKSFGAITADMVKQNLTKVVANTLSKTAVKFQVGDLVTVAVPKNRVATKDNGLGKKVAFATSATNPDTNEPIQSNGENAITIDGIEYQLYGEFMILSSGTLFIYVD